MFVRSGRLPAAEPAQDRWTDVVKPLAGNIVKMIDQVVDLLPEKTRDELLNLTSLHAKTICNNFPKPYGDEIMCVPISTSNGFFYV